MNAKMKVLSLALVGLCGYAGSAMAACPDGPDTANGGAWNDVYQIGGTATIEEGGLAGTQCRLDSKLATTAGASSTAAVYWEQATAEPRYRARFIIKADTIASPALADAVSIHSSSSGAGGAGVDFGIAGSGGSRVLLYSARYDDASGRRYKTGSVPLPSGEVVVEYDLKVASAGGSDGYFHLWVNNNDESNPTKKEDGLANSALSGIDNATLGLAGPTSQFVTHFGGQAVAFDQYDSRRQTFIGTEP